MSASETSTGHFFGGGRILMSSFRDEKGESS
jgi:hypothetical protein